MKETKKKKKFINSLMIGSILSIIIWIGIEEYIDTKVEKVEEIINIPYDIQKVNSLDSIEEEEEQKTRIEEYPKEEIEEEYKGYLVAAKLEIPAIELETYILKQYSKEALNISVTKFWGANPNEIGNFCVAGHNFQNKNMFRNLRKLEIGENFFILDNDVGKIEYKIYDIYTVEPEDVDCLSQETNGKREVTLITCTSDSKKRIIVKAKELEK